MIPKNQLIPGQEYLVKIEGLNVVVHLVAEHRGIYTVASDLFNHPVHVTQREFVRPVEPLPSPRPATIKIPSKLFAEKLPQRLNETSSRPPSC